MADSAPKTILVVEDDTSIRGILVQKLEKEGYATIIAGDGSDGLVLALHKHPDLILLDIMMPHDGLTMLQELRKDSDYGAKAPVILLTNLSPDTEQIIHSIEQHEPAFYLVKANNTPSQVVEKIKDVFSKQ